VTRALFLAAIALALAAPAATAARRPAPEAPADTLRLSVDDAVARAMATSAEARAAYAGVRVADGQVKEASAIDALMASRRDR